MKKRLSVKDRPRILDEMRKRFELRVMRRAVKAAKVGETRGWTREEFYAERLNRYSFTP